MAKGPIVTAEVEALIASVYQKHPKWKAKEVHNEVSSLLRKENPKLPSKWPSLSTVQKVLATFRKNIKETPIHPEDRLWSMGTLDEYPIPPDAIPSVVKVWKLREERLLGPLKAGYSGLRKFSLTIRQAKWAGRLAHIVEDIELLSQFADKYAAIEQVYQSLGHPFDSRALDYTLMTPDKPNLEELLIATNFVRYKVLKTKAGNEDTVFMT